TVTFGENVIVTGTPKLTLNTTPSRTASFASGSGSSTPTFDYTVQAGDAAADLDYAATTSLTLNGGAILAAAGNSAPLTLPAAGRCTPPSGISTRSPWRTAAPRLPTSRVTQRRPSAHRRLRTQRRTPRRTRRRPPAPATASSSAPPRRRSRRASTTPTRRTSA